MKAPTAVGQRLQIRAIPIFWGLWLAGLLAFALMAGFAGAFSHFPADLWLAHRLQDIEAAAFVRAMDWAEKFSGWPLVAVVWLGAVVALWLGAWRWEAGLLLVSMAGWGLNSGMKELVDRPRPSPDLAGLSFPSGHTTTAIVIYGLIFYFALFVIRQPLLRLPVQLACVYVVVFTALERVYVGAHWPSDILGSFLFAGLFLALLIGLHRRWRASLKAA